MSKKPARTLEQQMIIELKKINEKLGCLVIALVILPLFAGLLWFFS